MSTAIEMNLQLASGMDSFLRMMSVLRRKEVEIIGATFEGTGARIQVAEADVARATINLNKLIDVQVIS